MSSNPVFPEKHYPDVGVTVRPLSGYECAFELPDTIASVFAKLSQADDFGVAAITKFALPEIAASLSTVTGKPIEFWRTVPADRFLEIAADFMEMSFTDNFFGQAERAVDAGKQLGSNWFSFLVGTGMPRQPSEPTPSDRSRDTSEPSSD